MYLVKTYLDKSLIHGIGVFAAEFIKAGTKVREFHPAIDICITQEQFDKLSKQAQKLYELHAHRKNGSIVLSADNSRFENHSDSPNLMTDEQDCDYAARNIAVGEELTSNYYEFDEFTREHGIIS